MSKRATISDACHLCGEENYEKIAEVSIKPELETDYGIPNVKYYREICKCNHCDVFFNRHDDLLDSDFYKGHYNASIKYGSIKKRFEKIIEFPIDKSDNKQRAQRVQDFLKNNGFEKKTANILDVGSGTCVFLHEMMKFNHHGYCIDPDPISIQHAIENVKVNGGFEGELNSYKPDIKFDLITFNKVLEHIKNPAIVLKQAVRLLNSTGFIYVELPDGTEIAAEGKMVERSEFFLEHYLTFNEKGFQKLVELAELELVKLERIEDPSGKHTIYGFLKQR